MTTIACKISGWLQAFQVVIVITVHGTSTIKLDFVWRLSSTHPEWGTNEKQVQEFDVWSAFFTFPGDFWDRTLSSFLQVDLFGPSGTTLPQPEFEKWNQVSKLFVRDCLLPLLRFGQLDCVQPGPCFLVQHLHNLVTECQIAIPLSVFLRVSWAPFSNSWHYPCHYHDRHLAQDSVLHILHLLHFLLLLLLPVTPTSLGKYG